MAHRKVLVAVREALADTPDDWRTTLARKLAAALDEEPNASMARELRALMADIRETAPQVGGTALDELHRRRGQRKRPAAAG